MDPSEIYNQVNERYGSITKSRTGQYEQTVAKAFGYTADELAGIPEGANLGLSCGNPLALAGLKEGECVIDLGCGAGFDIFAAGRRVGATGVAIGVDMNKSMIDKANANKAQVDAENVRFVEGAITSIPLPDNTADCIISNCVINLVPAAEKQLVFHEVFRLLKPGGRVAVSDILARKELTDEMKNNVALYVGCVAGASVVSEYDTFLRNAGFGDILIVDSKNDLNVYRTAAETPCCGQEATDTEASTRGGGKCSAQKQDACCSQAGVSKDAKTLVSQLGIPDLNEWAGSFQVYAVKPVAV